MEALLCLHSDVTNQAALALRAPCSRLPRGQHSAPSCWFSSQELREILQLLRKKKISLPQVYLGPSHSHALPGWPFSVAHAFLPACVDSCFHGFIVVKSCTAEGMDCLGTQFTI